MGSTTHMGDLQMGSVHMGEVIEASHRRVSRLGVDPARSEVPWVGEPTPEEDDLTELVRPLLDHLHSQFRDCPIGVVMADSSGRVTHRSGGTGEILGSMDACGVDVGYSLAERDAGTTGVGTCLETNRPTVVVGEDHYLEMFRPFTCVNSPIVDPISSAVRGTIGIMCPVGETNPLLLPMTTTVAWEMAHIILERATPAERILVEEFLRSRTSAESPVLTVNADVLIAGPAAQRLLSGVDHRTLWEHVSAAIGRGGDQITELTRDSLPPVGLRCRPLHRGAELQGAVVELVPAGRRARRSRREPRLPGMVGSSERWRAVVTDAQRAALSREPLLITGERGSGRLTLARAVAALSGEPGAPVADCGAVAHLGARKWLRQLERDLESEVTVVLRNVELLPDRMAAAVAGMIEQRPAGTRIIATSGTTDPSGTGAAMLQDLLSVLRIRIPPLRHRRSDIVEISRHLLAGMGHTHVPRSLTDVLRRQPWPGNVRELEAVLRATVDRAGARPLELAHLPPRVDRNPTRRPLHGLEQREADDILEALRTTGGNKVRAARLLGISRATLYRRIDAFDLHLG